MGDLKNRKHYTTTLPINYIETILKLADKTSIPQSKLAEEAYKDLFKKRGIKIKKEPDNLK